MKHKKIYKMLVDFDESYLNWDLDERTLYGFKDKTVKVGDTITVDLCMWDDRQTLIEMKIIEVDDKKIIGTFEYLNY